MMADLTRHWSVYAVCLIGGLACVTEEGRSVQREPLASPLANDPLGVPAVAELCEMDPRETPWSACDWYGSLDAVVVATVQFAELSYSPVAAFNNSAGTTDIVPTCSVGVNPALSITVNVEQVIKGAVASGPLLVNLGSTALQRLDPAPVPDGAGDIKWVAQSDNPGGPLVPGTRLVIPLRQFSAYPGVWTVGTEHFLGFDSSGLVRRQRTLEGCAGDAPVEMAGISQIQLASMLGSCPTSTPSAVARREVMGLDSALWIHAAHCLKDVDPPGGGCSSTAQCELGFRCVERACVPL